ncbi:MAG TPA: tetratricopeptide repeat protein [Terriglobales bacterium]|nr:tetratricopeptide repeat protein [Terriglobales bacterium]
MRRSGLAVGLILLFVSVIFTEAQSPKASPRKIVSGRFPVTTSSPQARQIFAEAMLNFEQFRLNETLDSLRTATGKDPDFALAFILISDLTKDPEEQARTLKRAKALAGRVSSGERLLITWLGGVQEENYVPAIAAMNDLLATYPNDPHLLFLAGRWLQYQERYEQSAMLLEKAVALSPNYPAAINELGYAYAHFHQFDKALAAMQRYVALQPEQPNPHDSYGEILRMAGRFDEALEQYRMAVRIDPSFGSDLGIADTLALMGREEEAREQYARGMPFVKNEAERVGRELQSAATWLRENNYRQADHAYKEAAHHAHLDGLAVLEAEADRLMAMYESDYKISLKHLQAAESALHEGHTLSKAARDAELARVLCVRVSRAAQAGQSDAAQAALQSLEAMAQNERSQIVQLSWHTAEGAVLLAQEKYVEAITQLREDPENPFALQWQWQAYQHMGAHAEAELIAEQLNVLNVPTAEQALVVPAFRASLVSQAETR